MADANNLTFKEINANNNVSLIQPIPEKMALLTPKEILDKYPQLGIDWTVRDLIYFHEKGLFLAKPNEDNSSILIIEESIVELIKVREVVLAAKMDILKKNIDKGKQIPKTQ
ncbi:MAG: hypothetical protein GQ574_26720 [Crocinitomix sp.]|nr:hypothetical protein [Crocinitomix sp.]